MAQINHVSSTKVYAYYRRVLFALCMSITILILIKKQNKKNKQTKNNNKKTTTTKKKKKKTKKKNKQKHIYFTVKSSPL